jgi:prepilin-type N-terminal cleavage/methylation domain-containing protein
MKTAGIENRSHRRHRAGFTLLELVVVLLVVSVVAMTVVPVMRNFARGRKLSDAAVQVMSLANYARTQSVAQGKYFRLNFDPQAGAYWLTARTYDRFEELGNEFGQRFVLPEGVRMECGFQQQQPQQQQSQQQQQQQDSGPYIELRPSGRIDPNLQPTDASGAIIVKLSDGDGTVKQIVCDSPTELFRIVD